MAASLDWAEFERILHDGVVRTVTAAVRDRTGERFYAAVLDHIYREQDGVIALPVFGINSVEALARKPAELQDEVRWNAPDWDDYADDWLPPEVAEHWQRALTAEACAGTTDHWNETFKRFLATLVRVCRRARKTLRANGVTDKDFVVVLIDLDDYESLIKQVLTAAEVSRHFPELDERAVALAELAALPPGERAVRLVDLLGTFGGPVDSEDAEEALRDLGPAAFPALIDLLGSADGAWQAAKILADIGRPTESVIHALYLALGHADADHWAAIALSRLGRLDLVLARADSLSEGVVASAVAGPYTSFRDHAVVTLPLDYRPLAWVIEHWPGYLPALTESLTPGSGYCRITAAEVDTALHGLSSPHMIIRRHAVSVLGERPLGSQAGQRVLPLLCRAMRYDPDASIRRLAIFSLLCWGRDSRHLAGLVREALSDPDAAVREAAAYWLREQQLA